MPAGNFELVYLFDTMRYILYNPSMSTETLLIRVSSELKALVRKLAGDEKRSMSKFVEILLERELKK